MLNVIALCPRGRKNGGIRNGGGMVAHHGTGENRRNGEGQEEHILRSHNGDGNRNEDAESSPGVADGEAKTDGHKEEDGRQHGGHRGIHIHYRPNEAPKIEILLAADPRKGPGQAEDENGRCHELEPYAKAVAKGLKAQDAPWQIEHG